MRRFSDRIGLQSMGDGAGLSVTKSQHMMVCVEWAYCKDTSSGVAPQDLFVYADSCPGNDSLS